MYKKDLALNNLQWLICHKKPNQTFYLRGLSLKFMHLLQMHSVEFTGN